MPQSIKPPPVNNKAILPINPIRWLRGELFIIRVAKAAKPPKTKDIVEPTVNIPVVEQIDCTTLAQILTANATGKNTLSYRWSLGGTTASTLAVTDSGTYTVTVTDDVNHCTVEGTQTVVKDVDVPTQSPFDACSTYIDVPTTSPFGNASDDIDIPTSSPFDTY